MKKCISALLICALVLTLAPALAGAARAAGYDAAAAVTYADEHWNDGVGVCDQFVKACLAAGGISLKSGTVMGVYSELLNYGACSELTPATDGYIYQQDNAGKVAPGDILFFACSRHATPALMVHTAIVTKIAGNGRVLYSQHSGAQHNASLGWFADEDGHSGDDIRYYAVHPERDTADSGVTVTFDAAGMRADAGATDASISFAVTVARSAAGAAPTSLGYTVYAGDGTKLGEYALSNRGEDYVSDTWVVSRSTAAAGMTLEPETLYRYRGFVVIDRVRHESADKYFTTAAAGATVEFGDWFVSDVTETDAKVHASVSYSFEPAYRGPEKTQEIGVRLYDGALKLLGSAKESADISALVEGDAAKGVTAGALEHDWSAKALGAALTPGTQYYVQMFYRCGTEYCSELSAFTTAGTAPVCTLSYNANGGTGAPEFQTAKPGAGVILSGAVPTREGYVFGGWALTSDAAYAACAPESVFTLKTDTTLYAVWSSEPAPGALEVHFARRQLYFPGQFTDVPDDAWYTDYVVNAYELGLMKGTGDELFDPNGEVTVAQAVAMAARIHCIYTTGQENFVQTGVWYSVYLDYAYENGIIDSVYYNLSAKDLNRSATRAMFAEILSKALPDEALAPINTIPDNAIPDVKSTASCAPYVYKLYRAGILTGSDLQGSFLPSSNIKRSETAAIICRLGESSARRSFFLTAPAA